jgi:TRAP-type mannitol/chloroaromatic compound transport system permease large subunit
MIEYVFAIALIILAALGAPLFAVILAIAMIGFIYLGVDLSVIAVEIYRIADTPFLLALPLFTYAGYLMGQSRTSERLVRLTRVFLNWMPGGLAIVVLVACALFTAFTGASGVTIVALGALLYPALMQDGYQDKFSFFASDSLWRHCPTDQCRPELCYRRSIFGRTSSRPDYDYIVVLLESLDQSQQINAIKPVFCK